MFPSFYQFARHLTKSSPPRPPSTSIPTSTKLCGTISMTMDELLAELKRLLDRALAEQNHNHNKKTSL
jgi:hypothetical protein